MASLLLLAILTASDDLGDWLALRMNGVDSSSVFAHDARSGVVMHSGRSPSLDSTRDLDDVRRSRRLLGRHTGRRGVYAWELLELSDPTAFAKRVLSDMGQSPSPASREGAWVDSYSPPVECDRELQYFVRKAKGPPMLFWAVPCNADQWARTLSFVEAFMSGSSPREEATREAFGPTGQVSQGDLIWLNTKPNAREVLARIGTPHDVWTQYPDGFTFVYRDPEVEANSYAVDFTRMRSVARVRLLTPMRWTP